MMHSMDINISSNNTVIDIILTLLAVSSVLATVNVKHCK